MLKHLCLFLIVFISTSCSTNKFIPDEKDIDFLLNNNHYSHDYQKLTGVRVNQPVTLFFPVISGAIFGRPGNNLMQVVTTKPGDSFYLSLPGNAIGHADFLLQPELVIIPADTKLLRLGTFHMYPDYQDKIGSGAFIDRTNSDALALVYFSKPASISGIIYDNKDSYEHEITITNPGWNWIKISQLSKHKYRLSTYDGSIENIDFAILLDDIISI